MDKQKTNWWIDLLLLVLFWTSFFPGLTGLEMHQWLGIAATAIAAWHLIVHWNWVESMTLRLFSRVPGNARMYYILDLGILLGFLLILISGMLISTWLDLPLSDFAVWTQIHGWVSAYTLIFVVMKLILHWRWVATAARRYILTPVPLQVDRERPIQKPPSVDRRDFIKLTGILGLATFATLHSMLDNPGVTQSQSSLPDQPVVPDASQSVLSTVPEGPSVAVDPQPASACTVLCPNGCAYPGSCRRYIDRNNNGLCDNGECL